MVIDSSDRNLTCPIQTTPNPIPPLNPPNHSINCSSEYEKSHSRLAEDGGKQLEGTVIAVSADSVFLDIGFKSEGILPLADFQSKSETVKPGDKLLVSVKGRDPDGYYQLSRTPDCASERLVCAGASFRRQGDSRRYRDRSGERWIERGHRSPGVHARIAQRNS